MGSGPDDRLLVAPARAIVGSVARHAPESRSLQGDSPAARVDACVRSGHAQAMIPERMQAAVYKGNQTIEVEDYPVPKVGPTDVLLEVSHCGVCGSDIHFVLEGWVAPNSVRRPRVQRHGGRGRMRKSRAGRSATPVVGGPALRCGKCEYCREGGRPCVVVAAPSARAGDFPGRVRRLHASPTSAILRSPTGLPADGCADRAARGLRSTGSPVRMSSRENGSSSPVADRSARSAAAASFPRDHRHRGERAPPARRDAVRAAGGGRSSCPTSCVPPPMPHATVGEPFDVALECSGHPAAMEAAPRPARGGRSARARRRRDQAAALRQQPHPAQRTHHHRLVRLRRRRLRASARAARRARLPERRSHRAGRRRPARRLHGTRSGDLAAGEDPRQGRRRPVLTGGPQ